MLRTTTLALALGLCLGTDRAKAQCPNGTPPPCNTQRTAVAPLPNSVAVLYFDSRDTADTFLAEGLSEEIATSLGHVPRLVVKIPSAVRRVQRANEGDVRAIGRALGVRWVVDGSVRRSGTQLRVSVRLVEADRETATWSNAFTSGTTNLLAIQEQIAREVATGVVGALTPVERASVTARPTNNAEAYEHYLKGNWYLGRRGPWLQRAIDEYEEATKRDPNFGAPRAGIALARVAIADYGSGIATDSIRRSALATADSVIQRDPSISLAWVARGTALRRTAEFGSARESLDRAIALEPNSVEAHYRLGQLFFTLGEFADARTSLRRALALDPARPVTHELLGVIAYFDRKLDDAHSLLDSALVLDPQYQLAMAWQAVVLFARGDTASARSMARARTDIVRGQETPTVANAATARDPILVVFMVGHGLAQALALVGRFDDAFAALQVPVFPGCLYLVLDPAFDPVRRDPRFRSYETACGALKPRH